MLTVASTNTRGTARPTRPAVAVPLRAIAAPGAMIAMDNAIASQKRSSRRSPRSCCPGRLVSSIICPSPYTSSGNKASTTRSGASSPHRTEPHAPPASDAGF